MLRSLCYLFFACCLLSCSKETVPEKKPGTEKEISNPAIRGITSATQNFDQSTKTYTITVPAGTDITALAFTFDLPEGAVSSPASGSVQNFTNPVTYTVTAEDGSRQTFTVVIVVPNVPVKSPEKRIISFSFKGLSPAVEATVDTIARRITASVPNMTDLTALVPTILISPKATISPASGVARDFSSELLYEVTAENGTSNMYTVNITKAGKAEDILVVNALDKYVAITGDALSF